MRDPLRKPTIWRAAYVTPFVTDPVTNTLPIKRHKDRQDPPFLIWTGYAWVAIVVIAAISLFI